ncbi:uncharacterized protein LOC113797272 [Dermatophagoides pteronyssinus]|uniref:uncharacterized protein LOC113797272 n=1 Tax=Dermatophagoides pteronyssinus TaxID=6956 RepID=UPI003F667C3D
MILSNDSIQQQQQHESMNIIDLSKFLKNINHSFQTYLNQLSQCYQYNSTFSDLIQFHRQLFPLLLIWNKTQHKSSIQISIPSIVECKSGWSYTNNANERRKQSLNVNYSIVTKWNLVCRNEWLQYLIINVFLIGFLIGFLLHYFLCYNIGYRRSYFSMLILQCISGTLSSLSQEFKHFALCRFLLGLSLPTISMISTDIMIEIAGIGSMSKIIFFNEMIRLFGVLPLSLIVYWIDDYQSVLLALSAPFILFLFWWCFFPESINYQLVHGHVQQLEKQILNIAHTNLRYIDQEYDDSLKRRIHIELAIYREFMISSLLADCQLDESLKLSINNHHQNHRNPMIESNQIFMSKSSQSIDEICDQQTSNLNIKSTDTTLRSIFQLPNMRRKFIIILFLSWINFTLNIGLNFFLIDFIRANPSSSSSSILLMQKLFNTNSINNGDCRLYFLFTFGIIINILAIMITYIFLLDRFGRKFTFLICSLLATLSTLMTGFSMSSISLMNSIDEIMILFDWNEYFDYSLISFGLMKLFQSSAFIVLIIWSYELLSPNDQCRPAFRICWAFGHLFLILLPVIMYYTSKYSRISLNISTTTTTKFAQIFSQNINFNSTTNVDESKTLMIKYPWHYLLSTLLLFISSIMSLILPETNGNNCLLPSSLLEAEMFSSTQFIGSPFNNKNENNLPVGFNSIMQQRQQLPWYSWRVLFNFQAPNIRPMGILKKRQFISTTAAAEAASATTTKASTKFNNIRSPKSVNQQQQQTTNKKRIFHENNSSVSNSNSSSSSPSSSSPKLNENNLTFITDHNHHSIVTIHNDKFNNLEEQVILLNQDESDSAAMTTATSTSTMTVTRPIESLDRGTSPTKTAIVLVHNSYSDDNNHHNHNDNHHHDEGIIQISNAIQSNNDDKNMNEMASIVTKTEQDGKKSNELSSHIYRKANTLHSHHHDSHMMRMRMAGASDDSHSFNDNHHHHHNNDSVDGIRPIINHSNNNDNIIVDTDNNNNDNNVDNNHGDVGHYTNNSYQNPMQRINSIPIIDNKEDCCCSNPLTSTNIEHQRSISECELWLNNNGSRSSSSYQTDEHQLDHNQDLLFNNGNNHLPVSFNHHHHHRHHSLPRYFNNNDHNQDWNMQTALFTNSSKNNLFNSIDQQQMLKNYFHDYQ